jgi:outer membrane protein insertion porin family
MSLNLKIFLCAALLSLLSQAAHAQSISKVEVKGQNRIEKISILDKISFKNGSTFSQSKVTADVKRLFQTGFFYDISVDLTGTVLTYTVVEKPVIDSVEYNGNRAFDDDDLKETTLIKSNELLDIKKVNVAISSIKKKYEEKGYLLTKVSYKTAQKKAGTRLIFEIDEGDKVKIKRVNLIGNDALTDSKIKAVMATKAKGIFGMGGSYQADALKRDKEFIGFIYRNEGYAQVKVSDAEVALTRDKRGMIVTYYINEGLRYKIGDVTFAGDIDFTEEEFLKEIKIDENEYFSQAVLLSDVSKLQAKYGDDGYAYTNVIPRPEFKEDSTVVGIIYDIKKGEKVSMGEINVTGNTNTRDKVVRRELRIFEGELYNETNNRNSLANVRRLGFFENVEFQKKVSPESSDIMDLDINVKERSTGQLNIGAGYGGFQGFTLQGSVQQANFLGKGINFGLNINYSEKRQQLFNLNLTDPYFNDTEWTVGFDAYKQLQRVLDYEDEKTGGAITVGRRFGDFLTTSLKYKFEKVDVELTDLAFTDVFTPERVEDAKGYSSGLTASVSYDKRNDRQFPTEGHYARLSLEQTGIFGEIDYTKASMNLRYYKPIFGSLIWRNNINYGWVGTSGGDVPINELYRLGGPNTIRGYDFFSIAQTRFSEDARDAARAVGAPFPNDRANIPFGGTQQFFYQLEFQWDLIKEAKIMGVVFFDVGMANDEFKFDELKSSYGFGVRWNSPMGPLRFEWGFPIDPNENIGEREQDFQFSIMQSF